MKFFVALCILVTVQLCLSEWEMGDPTCVGTGGDPFPHYGESTTVSTPLWDLSTPLLISVPEPCEIDFGGQCLLPWELKSCDFIRSGWPLCVSNYDYYYYSHEQYCCVDCNNPPLNSSCHSVAGADTASRRTCCPGEFGRGLLSIGCRCCGSCTPTRWCKRRGFCVSEYDTVKNFEYCEQKGGRLYNKGAKRCRGDNCACCVIPKA